MGMGKFLPSFSHLKGQGNNRIQMGERMTWGTQISYFVGLERKNYLFLYHCRLKMIDGLLYGNSLLHQFFFLSHLLAWLGFLIQIIQLLMKFKLYISRKYLVNAMYCVKGKQRKLITSVCRSESSTLILT